MSSKVRSQEIISEKFKNIQVLLNERSIRCWCASEANSLGYGGVTIVYNATGISRQTIHKGLNELKEEEPLDVSRIRRPGGGRKKITLKQSGLLQALDELIDPSTRGDPTNSLRWTSKSTAKLSTELNNQGYKISSITVYNLLIEQKYSLQSNKKTKEGSSHPDRDKQFNFINEQVKECHANDCPVLSVDTKKKENIGNYKNNGREWSLAKNPTEVKVHDFPDKNLGKVAPYGVYDLALNKGWVSLGISHDTAEFAVKSIRSWWLEVGYNRYKNSKTIMITADCGGSNGYRVRLWKYELQKLANEIGKEIKVCHFPPGTSKWNKIEHRMFCYITQNWRGRPLISLQTIVNLISSTTTNNGLEIKVKVDKNQYEKGIKIDDKQLAALNVQQMKFHGEWNYIIRLAAKV